MVKLLPLVAPSLPPSVGMHFGVTFNLSSKDSIIVGIVLHKCTTHYLVENINTKFGLFPTFTPNALVN